MRDSFHNRHVGVDAMIKTKLFRWKIASILSGIFAKTSVPLMRDIIHLKQDVGEKRAIGKGLGWLNE
jgi:hypothetical protein